MKWLVLLGAAIQIAVLVVPHHARATTATLLVWVAVASIYGFLFYSVAGRLNESHERRQRLLDESLERESRLRDSLTRLGASRAALIALARNIDRAYGTRVCDDLLVRRVLEGDLVEGSVVDQEPQDEPS